MAELTVAFESWADLAAQRPHLGKGGLFLPRVDPPPQPLSELTVHLVAPDGEAVTLPMRVVHVAADRLALAALEVRGVAVAVQPLLDRAAEHGGAPSGGGRLWWGTPSEAPPAVPGARPDPSPPQRSGPPPASAPPPSPAAEAEVPGSRGGEAPEGEAPEQGDPPADDLALLTELPDDTTLGTLYERIKAMPTSEKLRLAKLGERGARQLLLKDPNKTIHTFLIKNKGITLDEVRYMAGYRQTNPEVLIQIAAHREWSQNPQIVNALVCNPKTPATVAKKLLTKLSPSDLRRLAKSESVPRAVSAAARKLVVGS